MFCPLRKSRLDVASSNVYVDAQYNCIRLVENYIHFLVSPVRRFVKGLPVTVLQLVSLARERIFTGEDRNRENCGFRLCAPRTTGGEPKLLINDDFIDA